MMYKIMAYETANATEEFQAGNHVVIYCVEKKKNTSRNFYFTLDDFLINSLLYRTQFYPSVWSFTM